MNIVIVGHVDHGKSTIIGRLLADTNSLPSGKLESVKEQCRLNSRPFEYAFLLDALKDEQAQGITIDAARVFFQTKKRNYIILDAPGHIEFLRNMITGAARAEAALLVIDSHEGIMENSRRHGYMLSMLGIKQVVVLINKMDLANYSEQVYDKITAEYNSFLSEVGISPLQYIPVSGMQGDNITQKSVHMKWYKGHALLEMMDLLNKNKSLSELPFRMSVQDVYKFTSMGDNRRIVSGTIDSGKVKTGDEVIFFPSGKKSTIKSIEVFNESAKSSAQSGEAAGFTLAEQIYITRGEMAAIKTEPQPKVTTRILVSIFWLGHQSMSKNKDYIIKIGTARAYAVVEEVRKVIDASTLQAEKKEEIEKHDVAEIVLRLKKPMAFDLAAEIVSTGRFVIVDNYEISGGGIIREALADKESWARDIVTKRNFQWEKSKIPCTQRAEKYNQKSALLLVTGSDINESKILSKALEEKLFYEGKLTYYMGVESLIYGLDADLKNSTDVKTEQLRRLGELCHILLDAGLILIANVVPITTDEIKLIKTMVNPDFIEVIWYGMDQATDISFDLYVDSSQGVESGIHRVKELLQRRTIVYSPW